MKIRILSLCLLCLGRLAHAQTPDSLPSLLSYESPREYEIGGVRVTGAQYADANALITLSGLRVGEKIRLPGIQSAKAVQKLWDLKLFTDVQVLLERTQGDIAFLEIVVQEMPRYSRHSFKGVKKSKHDDLNGIINKYLQKGSILTDNAKATLISALRGHYAGKGYLDARIAINASTDERSPNSQKLEFVIDPGSRVKISSITFTGNNQVKARTLRKKMKETAQTSRIFKKSKFVRQDYQEDKRLIETYYNTLGFRDARVVSDSVWRNPKGRLMVRIDLDEGRRYYFRNISWKGNTLYETRYLDQVLGIDKGDVYNEELLNKRLQFSQDGRDISSLYLDNGYLFFRVDPIETAVDGDSIDLELRIFEGPQATIDRVVIRGNDRTHEHVIRRELFTNPGDKFSRADIIRSQRNIVNLGYFNPESLGINTPVNPDRGTVDIEYTVEEKPSDQLELSAGYQPSTAFIRGGIIGTLGVTFNNFSVRNLKDKSAWNPLPQGDGQRFSVRGQTAGDRFQSYNATFTEPWLGGKKPNSLTVGGFFNRFSQGFIGSDNFQRLDIIQGSVGFGTRLKFPDDNFIFRADLDIQTLRLNRWPGFRDDLGRLINEGSYNNFNLGLTFARNSINDPIYPRNGSLISMKVDFTPPYSWFRSQTFYDTSNVRQLYRDVEYVKWRFDAQWFTTLTGKLVLHTNFKLGLLGRWSRKTPLTPFERFDLGGSGLNNQNFGLNGRTIVSQRGYDEATYSSRFPGGAGVFQKATVEVRYPISLNPQSTIYLLAFAQGGNAWLNARDYNPFQMRRSVGIGARVFLPMFGTLGFDFGIGFDKPELHGRTRRLRDYSTTNIVLGFEPD